MKNLPTGLLASSYVWDGFLILSLLEDHKSRLETLIVPHDGLRKDRYTTAVRARNARIQLYGQEETRHYCNKCIRVYTDSEGNGSQFPFYYVLYL